VTNVSIYWPQKFAGTILYLVFKNLIIIQSNTRLPESRLTLREKVLIEQVKNRTGTYRKRKYGDEQT